MPCVPDLRDLPASQPGGPKVTHLNFAESLTINGGSGNAQMCRHIISHQCSPGRSDRIPRFQNHTVFCNYETCLGCWMPLSHVNEVLNEAVEVGGRHGEGDSQSQCGQTWRGRGGCGGCASSKLPSQKTALFFFGLFLFQKWNTHARSHRDLQLFVCGLADGCHLANPSADVASCLKTSSDVVEAPCSPLLRPCKILRMLIFFLSSFSHRILLFPHHTSCLSAPPSPDSSSPFLSLLLFQRSDHPQLNFLWLVSRGVQATPQEP